MSLTASDTRPSPEPGKFGPNSLEAPEPGSAVRARWRRNLIYRILVALLVSAAGLLLYYFSGSFTGGHVPLIILLPAVVYSAWFGGLIPGLISTLVCATYLEFFGPNLATSPSPIGGQLEIALFIPTGALASYLCGILHSAREFAEHTASALNLSRERYRLISETVSDYAFGYRFGAAPEEDELIWITPSFWRLTGYEEHTSASPMDWARIVHPDDLHLAWELMRNLREGTPGSREYRVLTPEGEVRWHRVYGKPMLDKDGKVTGCVGGGQDITEQKGMEAALRESESRYRTIVETAAEGIWLLDNRWRITFVNQRMADLLGTTPEEMLGCEITDYLFPEDHPALDVLADHEAVQMPYVNDHRYRRADGSEIWCRVAAIRVYDVDGSHGGAVSMHTDITERRKHEERQHYLAEVSSVLAESLDMETTLEHVAQLAVPRLADWCFIAAKDDDERIQFLAAAHGDAEAVRQFWERNDMFDLQPDAPYGLPAVLRTGKTEYAPDITEEMLTSGAQSGEHLQALPVLGYRSSLAVPLCAGGKILGAIMFAYSDSGRRYEADDVPFAEEIARRAAMAVENARLYRELQDADRRKDEFLAMLAHELRNPLAAISGASQVMEVMLNDEEKESLAMPREILVRQVAHLGRLVDDLLDVSRITRGRIELRRVPLDFGEVVRTAVASARGTIDSRRHRLDLNLASEPLPLLADPSRLQQIVANLVLNAAKYTEPGGLIQVSLARSGDEVILRVRDTGAGIKPEMLPHIWSLFTQSERTLDRSEGGLGIGLTLVRALTEMHGGRVEAHSNGPGTGSEFIVTLPLSQTAPESALMHAATAGNRRSRRILVVDDNRDAAETLAQLLMVNGHELRTAFDGEEGLRVATEWVPDTVLLDIGMTGLDGYQVARRLREDRHEVLLIAVTGYGQPGDKDQALAAGFDHHFTKPLDLEQLKELLAL